MMDQREILARVDHTILTPTATWEQVKAVCDEGKQLGVASVCIPPRYVKRANDYAGGGLKICTVVGFPNGYATPEVKVFETEDAIKKGAQEIDYVVNITQLKEKNYDYVEKEMAAIVAACRRENVCSKVIFENCYLEREEKLALCAIARDVRPDFIKTSTGFGTGGAVLEDVELMKNAVGEAVKIKAAGGIRTLEDALQMIGLGVSRIGSTASVDIVEELKRKRKGI